MSTGFLSVGVGGGRMKMPFSAASQQLRPPNCLSRGSCSSECLDQSRIGEYMSSHGVRSKENNHVKDSMDLLHKLDWDNYGRLCKHSHTEQFAASTSSNRGSCAEDTVIPSHMTLVKPRPSTDVISMSARWDPALITLADPLKMTRVVLVSSHSALMLFSVVGLTRFSACGRCHT